MVAWLRCNKGKQHMVTDDFDRIKSLFDGLLQTVEETQLPGALSNQRYDAQVKFARQFRRNPCLHWFKESNWADELALKGTMTY